MNIPACFNDEQYDELEGSVLRLVSQNTPFSLNRQANGLCIQYIEIEMSMCSRCGLMMRSIISNEIELKWFHIRRAPLK